MKTGEKWVVTTVVPSNGLESSASRKCLLVLFSSMVLLDTKQWVSPELSLMLIIS